MRVDVAVDVGNTRIKWGVKDQASSRILQIASLPEDPDAWQTQRQSWLAKGLVPAQGQAAWVLASVQPHRCERLRTWLEDQGDHVEQLCSARQLPLAVALEHPDRAGIDRLLNAVAAARVLPAGTPAILVDVGSAVTVDWLDATHTFRGGAIFPGLRLMAQALHQYTALLPQVDLSLPVPELPGQSTIPAMQAGVFWAVVGGIDRAADRLRRRAANDPRLFVTGGDAGFIVEALSRMEHAALSALTITLWPEQTLEGIRISAEALP
jgi:type III pantothenate kinase